MRHAVHAGRGEAQVRHPGRGVDGETVAAAFVDSGMLLVMEDGRERRRMGERKEKIRKNTGLNDVLIR